MSSISNATELARYSLRIPIPKDAAVEGSEMFPVTLSSPTGASLGSPSSATVTITDDDTAPVGTLQLGESKKL
jgi:hypothetical protein